MTRALAISTLAFVAGALLGAGAIALRPVEPPRVVEIVVIATPAPEPEAVEVVVTPTPPASNGLTRCDGFVWGLPVREKDYRVTATFGLKSAGSAYYTAMSEVGAIKAGAAAVQHNGVDFGLRPNSPVFAVTSGEVVTVTYSDQYGKYLVTRYGAREVYYGHLNDIFVELGQFIGCGQVIGISGATGKAVAGAHLHLEVREHGVPLDPMPLLEMARAAAPNSHKGKNQ